MQVTGVAGVTGIEFSASSPGVAIFTESWDSYFRPGLTVSRSPWAVHYHGPCLVQQRPTWPFADKVVPFAPGRFAVSETRTDSRKTSCLSKSVAEVLDHFLLR